MGKKKQQLRLLFFYCPPWRAVSRIHWQRGLEPLALSIELDRLRHSAGWEYV